MLYTYVQGQFMHGVHLQYRALTRRVLYIFQIFKDVQNLLAVLQNQYTGYSYNLVGGAPPNLAMEFVSPFHLIDYSPWRMTHVYE